MRSASWTLASSSPRPRRLHRGHFAFMRAVAQGLALRESWDRYLRIEGEFTDLRVVRSTIAWIRDEFAAAARRCARPGMARLVLIDVQQMAEDAPDLPSLDEFAQARGLEDFSQAEQWAAYEETYGRLSQRRYRRQRLVERQVEALHWLEALVAQPPLAGDAVAAWLSPALAGPLERSGVVTLAQLVDRINGIGLRWHGGIRAVGVTKARRIEDWLRGHEATLGLQIGSHVALPRSRLYTHELQAVVPPATGILPLEKLLMPSDLDGRTGRLRRPQEDCLLDAQDDHAAVLAWIRAKRGLSPGQAMAQQQGRRQRSSGMAGPMDWLTLLSHTQRACRKEAERFLLWAIVQRGKPLSSMTQEDCRAYREFLADPQPRDRWCGPRSRERWSPLWRPFEGPLSLSAQRQALALLRNLYGFLVDHNYLMGNPWTGLTVPRAAAPRLDTGRSLTQAQWRFVEARLAQGPPTALHQRLGLAVRLLYATGLRLSEVVQAQVGDLAWISDPGDAGDPGTVEGWWLTVTGKGGRLRQVPVPTAVIESLARHLAQRGLPFPPQQPHEARACLLGPLSQRRGGKDLEDVDPAAGLAATTLYRQLKRFFAACAEAAQQAGDPGMADRLRQASTHWLRHTHATHAIARGLPLDVAQQNLGHASLATTTAYVHTERRRRMKALQVLWSDP